MSRRQESDSQVSPCCIFHADHLAEGAVVEAVMAVVLLLLNVKTGDKGLLNKNQTSCGDLPVGHSVPSNSYSLSFILGPLYQ